MAQVPQPPHIPDYVALLEWLQVLEDHLKGRITEAEMSEFTAELADLRIDLDVLAFQRRLLTGGLATLNPGEMRRAVRALLAQGLCTWRTKERPSAGVVPPGLLPTVMAHMLLPLVMTPVEQLPPGWQYTLMDIAGEPLGRMVWSLHIAVNRRRRLDENGAFESLVTALGQDHYEEGVYALIRDMGDPEQGNPTLASVHRALTFGEPNHALGPRLIHLLWGGLSALAVKAVDGVVGNRFDALLMSIWEEFTKPETASAQEDVAAPLTKRELEALIDQAWKNKAYSKVVQLCTDLLQIAPDHAICFSYRAYAYKNMGQYDRAIADATRTIALDPSSALAYDLRADSYRMKNQFGRAIADANRAIALGRSSASAYETRGLAYYQRKNYREALQDLRRALQFDPGNQALQRTIMRVEREARRK